MEALLAELERDPAVARRRVGLVALACALVAGVIAWQRHGARERSLVCSGAAEQLAGIWDDARRAEIEHVLLASKKPYASTAWQSTRATLDDYAQRWVAMRTDACRATRIRGEQSEELLDLRTICLSDRLTELRALTNVLADPNADAVEKAVEAAQQLPSLDGCANPKALRARVRPPTEAGERARLAALEARIADIEQLAAAGLYARARALIDGVVDDAQKLGYAPLTATALFHAARLRWYLDDAPSDEWFHQAALFATRGGDDELAAQAWDRLSVYVSDKPERAVEAHTWARYAEATLGRIGSAQPAQAWHWYTLANLARIDGDLDEAAKRYERAADDFGRIGQLGNQAQLLGDAGNALSDGGRLDDAAAVCARSLALIDRVLGADHPKAVAALECLASVDMGRARFTEALERTRRVLAIDQASYGPDSSWLVSDWNNIAFELNELGRPSEALEALATSERLSQKPGGRTTGTAVRLVGQGEALVALGRAREAVPILERNLELTRTGALDKMLRARTQLALGRALAQLGRDAGRARSLGQEALAAARAERPTPWTLAEAQRIEAWLASLR
jgi:tetratricopeptide (TPR) repeat protein